jgi:hypothetical protein
LSVFAVPFFLTCALPQCGHFTDTNTLIFPVPCFWVVILLYHGFYWSATYPAHDRIFTDFLTVYPCRPNVEFCYRYRKTVGYVRLE